MLSVIASVLPLSDALPPPVAAVTAPFAAVSQFSPPLIQAALLGSRDSITMNVFDVPSVICASVMPV